MSKPSRRPTREARKQHKLKRRAAQRQLCARRAEMGRSPPRAASVSNRLCPYSTEAEEQAAREDAVAGQLGGVSDVVTEAVEGVEQDPGSPAAEEDQTQADGSVALWVAQLCVADGLAA
jgi:hypothetical protein